MQTPVQATSARIWQDDAWAYMAFQRGAAIPAPAKLSAKHGRRDMSFDQTATLRLFYALWPDDATRTALTRLQEQLPGRKMHPQDLHITLAFLGQQPASLLPELQALLRHAPSPDLRLRLDRIGYFPRSRIVWAGMQSVPDALVALHEALATKLTRLGIHSVLHETFTPHVTLARDAPAPGEFPVEAISWHANRMVLVQSISAPEAERYRVL